MSYHEYIRGRAIAAQDEPFYAVIQAAMRQASTDNLHKLQQAWPNTWAELQARYNLSGGRLSSDL